MLLRTEEPDLAAIPDAHCDWEESVYGKVEEALPTDNFKPLGKHVVNISFHNASLNHNVWKIVHWSPAVYQHKSFDVTLKEVSCSRD